MKELLSQIDFAKKIGKSRQYISKLKRENKLIFDGNLIDVQQTMKKLKMVADPTKKDNGKNAKSLQSGLRQSLQKDNNNDNENDDYSQINFDILENENPSDFGESKARKEYYLSKTQQLKFRKEAGELIAVSDVMKHQYNYVKLIRDMLENIPKRVSNQLSAMDNPIEINNLLDKEIATVFEIAVAKAQEEIEEIEKDED